MYMIHQCFYLVSPCSHLWLFFIVTSLRVFKHLSTENIRSLLEWTDHFPGLLEVFYVVGHFYPIQIHHWPIPQQTISFESESFACKFTANLLYILFYTLSCEKKLYQGKFMIHLNLKPNFFFLSTEQLRNLNLKSKIHVSYKIN